METLIVGITNLESKSYKEVDDKGKETGEVIKYKKAIACTNEGVMYSFKAPDGAKAGDFFVIRRYDTGDLNWNEEEVTSPYCVRSYVIDMDKRKSIVEKFKEFDL
jgi:hypothetical protein